MAGKEGDNLVAEGMGEEAMEEAEVVVEVAEF